MVNAQPGTILRQLRQLAEGPGGANPSDQALLQRFAREGDEAAFAALLRRHGPMVLGLCRRMLGHEHDAEDAFQATFLILAQKAGSIRRQEALARWLHRVSYHLAVKAQADALKRNLRERRVFANRQQPAVGDAGQELRQVLDEELERLPEKLRAPLLLCCLEGKTKDEAAHELGCPLGTLKSRLERGRELLRTQLSQRGLTFSGALLAVTLGQSAAPATVPMVLGVSTVNIARLVTVGAAAATAAIPAKVILLAEGALRPMLMTRFKTALFVAVGLFGLGGGLLTVSAWDDKPSAQQAVAQEEDLVTTQVKVGNNVFVEMEGKKARRVLIQANVCVRDGMLEQLLTRKKTKEHEAILAADVDARDIHTGLLLAGAEAGRPVQFQPKAVPAIGTTVRITLEYTNDAGQVTRIPAQRWIRHAKLKKDLAHDWVFAGSAFALDAKDPTNLRYLANDGDIICVANFESALLDLPIPSSTKNDDLDFEAHAERIPPLGTAVLVILEPVAAKNKAPRD